MRILVTGSRDWQEWGVLAKALTRAAGTRHPSTITVVHGGARGADTMADIEAHTRGWKVEVHEPDWDHLRSAAGPVRNAAMVRAGADVCLAFFRSDRENKGSADCVWRCERAGIPVKLYWSDGEGGVREPGGDSPDSPPAGEPGIPGQSGKGQAIENRAGDPWRIEPRDPFRKIPEFALTGP